MSGADISKIIAKVAHLRALAAGAGTREEAEAALLRADEIMQRYRLEEADVGSTSTEPGEAMNVESEPLYVVGSRSVQWCTLLGSVIAKHFGAACFEAHTWNDLNRIRKEVSLRIVGKPSDVALVRYVFAWVRLEIVRLSRNEKGSRRVSFCRGAVQGVSYVLARARKAAADAHIAAGGKADSLAKIDTHAAAVDFANACMRIKPQAASKPGDVKAFIDGMRAGSKINVEQAALPAPSKRLLGQG